MKPKTKSPTSRSNRFLLLFIATILLETSSYGRVITGQVFRTNSSLYLPFTHIIVGDHEQDLIADEQGYFQVELNKESIDLTFRGFMHRAKTITLDSSTKDSIKVFLNQNELFVFLRNTNEPTTRLMQRVIDNRSINNPNSHCPYSYSTYSKFYLTSDKIEITKTKVQKILKKLKLDLKDFKDDHHLILTESTTKRDYMNKVCENEVITSSKVSGIEKPSFLTVGSQIQPFTIYDPYIKMAGTTYTGPITKRAFKRYAFQILDTIPGKTDTTFVVKFNSKINKRFEGLKGLLFINTYKYGIERMILEPTIDRSLGTKLVKINTLVQDSIWFPSLTKTIISIFNIGSDKLNFIGIAETHFKDIRFDTSYKRKQFSEVVYQVDDSIKIKDSTFWQGTRSAPLTNIEKATYEFYDTVGTLRNFDGILRLVENAYFHQIPYKFLTIDTRRFIAINQYEGLRLGLGLHTNEKVTKHASIGGFAGYGFRDRAWKYGGELTLFLSENKEWNIYGKIQKEVLEAGNAFFTHDKYQYSSEGARKFKVRWMDKVDQFETGINFRLFDYVRSNLSVLKSQNESAFFYRFNGELHPSYNITELRAGFKYTYGEKYLKVRDRKISLGSQYPRLWVQYGRGTRDMFSGDLEYNKYDVKLEYEKVFLGLGTMNLQITAGMVDNDIPYYLLYNGKGSREVGAVAHNSFETMSYNEYLSSKYVSLFYTQQFGKLNFVRFKNYTPSIEFIQGIGYGTLDHPDSHLGIDYKTMEKGYFESGISINQLVMFKTLYIRSGFGVAFFYRYGPDASTKFTDNAFIKLAFNFKL